MKRAFALLVAGTIAWTLSGRVTPAMAEQRFQPNVVISPQTGKWTQPIQNRPVSRIDCQVDRVSGGDDTYINFRFGNDGHTVPGGKRFYLTKDGRTKLRIPLDGMSPNGKPLVVNAYNGSVKIVFVTVHFQ